MQEPFHRAGALHPIGVVAKRTGLSLHVLRAWERRYGAVAPERRPDGQRLYRDEDIERLRLLRQVTEAGRSISHVAKLSDEALAELASGDVDEVEPASGASGEKYVAACVEAAERLDGEVVYGTLMRAVVRLGSAEFTETVVGPLLYEVGDRWHAGLLGPAQEHVVSISVRRVLSWLAEAYEATPGSPLLIVTTLAGEQHEFGAMLVGVIAQEEGWRVSYLGPSLPASEIARASKLSNAALVALSIVSDESGRSGAVTEVSELVLALGSAVPVLVGGAGGVAHSAALEATGAHVVGTLEAARDTLRLRRGRFPAVGR